jgi:hypothetical protein
MVLSSAVKLDKLPLAGLLMKRKSVQQQLRTTPSLHPVRIAVLGGSTTSGINLSYHFEPLGAGD